MQRINVQYFCSSRNSSAIGVVLHTFPWKLVSHHFLHSLKGNHFRVAAPLFRRTLRCVKSTTLPKANQICEILSNVWRRPASSEVLLSWLVPDHQSPLVRLGACVDSSCRTSRSRLLCTKCIRSVRAWKAPACGSSMANPSKHLRSDGCWRGSNKRNLSLEKMGDSISKTSWSNCCKKSKVGSKAAKRAVSSLARSYCWDHRHKASALAGLWNHGSNSSRNKGPTPVASADPRTCPASCRSWGCFSDSSRSSSRKTRVSAAVNKIQLKVCTNFWANSLSSSFPGVSQNRERRDQ